MRINKFLAAHTTLSRRGADAAIAEGRVLLNGRMPGPGDAVGADDTVILDNQPITPDVKRQTIMFNKPVGYVCSRDGQGSNTVYDILPTEYQHLNLVGRLDKNSSGLLLLTNDGDLANELTHPRYSKAKVYEIRLNNPLAPLHQQMISDIGVQLSDGPSQLALEKLDAQGLQWRIRMREGRNRQIRRTFDALGYSVTYLHRTTFGEYSLAGLKSGEIRPV
jgi:23S rRNA pseudouridine2605 synthase